MVDPSSSDALSLDDFIEDAARCRERGGGLSEFLRLGKVVRLRWPADVGEQWLYDHAGSGPFLDDYGGVDLARIGWQVEAISRDVLMELQTGRSDADAIERFAKEPQHWVDVRRHGVHTGVAEMWDVHGTWKRWPLVLDRALLGPVEQGLQVEGRTRAGIMRGRHRQGSFVADRHLVWVGRPELDAPIEDNIEECGR